MKLQKKKSRAEEITTRQLVGFDSRMAEIDQV
jgi:hypothetical protein